MPLFPRKIEVEFSKVTSAVWGAFDQCVVTGHADGTVAKYDLLEVSRICQCTYSDETVFLKCFNLTYNCWAGEIVPMVCS